MKNTFNNKRENNIYYYGNYVIIDEYKKGKRYGTITIDDYGTGEMIEKYHYYNFKSFKKILENEYRIIYNGLRIDYSHRINRQRVKRY